MPIRAAHQALTRAGSSRAGRSIGLAALALLMGNTGLQNAVAEGDTRTISLHHIHTGEDLTITYKRDGRYDEDALKKVNHLLRDWRRDEEIRMDPRLLDVVWEVYRDVDAKGPIHVVCGYRSPSTNAMLRRRSRGVAEQSQHMLGRAMDFFIPNVSLEAQREAGLRLQRGGVGYYPTSGSPFVHLDVGSVRHWPRMTHDQLAHVFPDGRTVHVPSDGRPLKAYALALADIQKRGSSEPSQMSLDAARSAGVDVAEKPRRNLLASLFRSKDEEEDSQTAAEPKSTEPKSTEPKPDSKSADRRGAEQKGADQKGAATKTADAKTTATNSRPTPRVAAKTDATNPAGSFNLASADSRPIVPTPRDGGAQAFARGNDPIADVITSRGFWDAPPAAATPAMKERMALASAESRPAPAPQPRTPATDTTSAVAAPSWPVKTADAGDRIPRDAALSYAAPANTPPAAPVTRSLTTGATIPRNAATVARQDAPVPPTSGTATIATLKPGTPLEDPWLRALVLAPNLRSYLTAMLLGDPPDPRELVALMEKPGTVVVMTFGEDPNLGMTTERFTGSAVVFVNTVTIAKRTAALH